MGTVAAIRIAGLLLAVVALASMVAGCAEMPAPPPPTSAELPLLISRAEGNGSNGYTAYGVKLVRFISDEEWPTVMTECVRSHGITNVDFRLLPPGPYTYPADPQGGAALSRAVTTTDSGWLSERPDQFDQRTPDPDIVNSQERFVEL